MTNQNELMYVITEVYYEHGEHQMHFIKENDMKSFLTKYLEEDLEGRKPLDFQTGKSYTPPYSIPVCKTLDDLISFTIKKGLKSIENEEGYGIVSVSSFVGNSLKHYKQDLDFRSKSEDSDEEDSDDEDSDEED